MAASMTPSVLTAKEKVIDHMEDMFHEKLKSFTSDVKTKMRSVSREAAIQVFELALLFLTQAVPDLGGFESASDVVQGETMELRKDFEKLEKTLSQKLKEAQEYFSEKLEDAQQTFSEKLEDAQQTFSEKLEDAQQTFSEKLEDAQQTFSEKLEDAQQTFSEKFEDAQQTMSEKFDAQQTLCEKLEDARHSLSEKIDAQQNFCENLEYDQQLFFGKFEDAQQNLSEKSSELQEKASSFQHRVQNDLDKLNKASESNTHQILGLRKLQKLLSDKTKISQTTAVATPSTKMASASAAATPCGPPKSLSQRSTFSARSPHDIRFPHIMDTKVLPGGLVVFCDSNNNCVKLYDWQGRHIHTQALDSYPWSMTVMDIRTQTSWDLCVTLPKTRKINLMRVTPNSVNIKTSIQTTREYTAIAAVTTQTLAVGYWFCAGIDLIDLSGRILRQLSSTLSPCFMVTTPDGFLTYTDNSVVKINLEDETIVFRRKVKQIKNPRGIAYTMDGSLIVGDKVMRTLHLIGADGGWLKKLWTHPGGQDARDELCSVSVIEQTCICCTGSGSVFVTDVSY